MMFWYVSNVTKATPERKMITIVVHQGDTLWALAQKIAPNIDPRLLIKEIKDQNRLTSSELVSGQRLNIFINSESF